MTPPGGSATDDTWDAYGDLASAGTVSYGYDALGRLASRTAGSGSATSLSYLGTSGTLASDGTSDYSYTPSGAVTGVQQSGGAAYTTMTDQHGDVIAAFSPTSAAQGLAGYSSYSPYGAKTSANYSENLGYQGDYADPTTGLVYMNARWYNPATGTFTSSDTLGGTPIPATVDGNPYAYADGNPLTNTDPTGMFACGICDDVGHYVEEGAGDVARAVEPELEAGLEGAADGAECGPECMALGGLAAILVTGSWQLYRALHGSGSNVSYNYEGSPAPTWQPEQEYPPYGPGGGPAPTWSPVYSSGGWSASGGASGSSGYGYWQYAVPYYPPPPPPPPQDCYAGPDPTCTVPTAPGSLLHTPVVTAHVKNITSYSDLCQLGDCIGEKVTSKQGAVKGLTTGGNDNPSANANHADQNDQQLLQPIKDQGVQPTPAAEGAGGGRGAALRLRPPAPAAVVPSRMTALPPSRTPPCCRSCPVTTRTRDPPAAGSPSPPTRRFYCPAARPPRSPPSSLATRSSPPTPRPARTKPRPSPQSKSTTTPTCTTSPSKPVTAPRSYTRPPVTSSGTVLSRSGSPPPS